MRAIPRSTLAELADDRARPRNRLFLLLLPIYAAGLLLSTTRSAFVGIAVGLAYLGWKRYRVLLLLIPAGLVALAFVRGLFTFLLLEKIKGKPISPKAQAIAQYVGLALLLGIFLFVTWQDVMNFNFRMR